MTDKPEFGSLASSDPSWDQDRILAALSSFEDEPVPDDVEELVTGEYRLVRYPERLVSPTFPAVQVDHLDLTRSFDDVFEEVAHIVRSWGVASVHWWVSACTTPPDVERKLLEQGATLSDNAQVLARAVGAPEVTLQVPRNVTVKEASDADAFRAVSVIETSGWGRAPLGEAELRSYLEARLAGNAQPTASASLPTSTTRQPLSDGAP
jgi:hypothetical protein